MVKHSSGKCYYSEKYRDQYLGWYSDTYIAALQVMTTFNSFNDQQRKAVATNVAARFKVYNFSRSAATVCKQHYI